MAPVDGSAPCLPDTASLLALGRRGGRLIELTPREFALLECLMRAPGKALSRALILEKVWGCSKHPLTNIVDVYIRQPRRKVDRDAPPALVQTVRGFGYKLRNS